MNKTHTGGPPPRCARRLGPCPNPAWSLWENDKHYMIVWDGPDDDRFPYRSGHVYMTFSKEEWETDPTIHPGTYHVRIKV